jgi:glutaryl-CoA dehydrogenase
MHPIHEFGSSAQKDRFLPGLGVSSRFPEYRYADNFFVAKGEIIGCFVCLLLDTRGVFIYVYQGLTEADHGSDPAGMETTAGEVDGGFVINGSKTWISNAPVA